MSSQHSADQGTPVVRVVCEPREGTVAYMSERMHLRSAQVHTITPVYEYGLHCRCVECFLPKGFNQSN